MKLIIKIQVIAAILSVSCAGSPQVKNNNQQENNMITDSTKQYGYNRDFLRKYIGIIELKNKNSALCLIPSWQGRVMTSTSEGDEGFSFGWINHDLISSQKILKHINAFGGEERLWLGPEGGQFSIFFSKGTAFSFENWQTPAFLDTTPYDVIELSDTSALFECNVNTLNYSGTHFDFKLKRKISLLSEKEIIKLTGIKVEGTNCVAYSSDNTIINKGEKPWIKETGLLSIWMLGMFNPSPSVVVVIPFIPGDTKISVPPVNDNYFGKISEDRLKVTGNHIFFKADGKSRGKIGIPPRRSTGKMGSFDSENNILTVLICNVNDEKTDYVNSSWKIQEDPYSGDAMNSYNDGPLEDGSQMGPFYELESSSPAADLKPGESLSHVQFTFHFTGDINSLDSIAIKVLGTSLNDIKTAF